MDLYMRIYIICNFLERCTYSEMHTCTWIYSLIACYDNVQQFKMCVFRTRYQLTVAFVSVVFVVFVVYTSRIVIYGKVYRVTGDDFRDGSLYNAIYRWLIKPAQFDVYTVRSTSIQVFPRMCTGCPHIHVWPVYVVLCYYLVAYILLERFSYYANPRYSCTRVTTTRPVRKCTLLLQG